MASLVLLRNSTRRNVVFFLKRSCHSNPSDCFFVSASEISAWITHRKHRVKLQLQMRALVRPNGSVPPPSPLYKVVFSITVMRRSQSEEGLSILRKAESHVLSCVFLVKVDRECQNRCTSAPQPFANSAPLPWDANPRDITGCVLSLSLPPSLRGQVCSHCFSVTFSVSPSSDGPRCVNVTTVFPVDVLS